MIGIDKCYQNERKKKTFYDNSQYAMWNEKEKTWIGNQCRVQENKKAELKIRGEQWGQNTKA